MLNIKKMKELSKYDSRLVELNIQLGKLSKEEWETYLTKLPDLSSQVKKWDEYALSQNLEKTPQGH